VYIISNEFLEGAIHSLQLETSTLWSNVSIENEWLLMYNWWFSKAKKMKHISLLIGSLMKNLEIISSI
jgi:hypothetical protein